MLLALPMTLLLVAVAFFLPDQLSRWKDGTLLDQPQIMGSEAGEQSFANSIRLTLPEKLRLLRSGTLTPMEIPEEEREVHLVVGPNGSIFFSEEPAQNAGEPGVTYTEAPDIDVNDQQMERRLEQLRQELLALQKVGAMPLLWEEGSQVELHSSQEVLYIEMDTQVSFPVCYLELRSAPYSLSLTVDGQTGKILAFSLRWTQDGSLRWAAGTSNFSNAWKEYWDMDGVNVSYMSSQYLDGILSQPPPWENGPYTASTEVAFYYGDEVIRVPLLCRNGSDMSGGSLQWNS